jgi:hypothetical protein
LTTDASPVPEETLPLEEIVRRAYRLVFARTPSETELRLGTAFLATADSPAPPEAVVRQYAQALLGTSEFMFVD